MLDPGTMEFGTTLVDEIGRVRDVFGVRLVIWVTGVVAVTILARAALAAAVRLAWRVGLDRGRRLGRFAALLRVLLWAVGALAALRPIFTQVPVLTTLALALFGVITAIATPGILQSIVAGLSLALRARLREGDQIEVEGYHGSVRNLGLVRTQLRMEDGSVVWLPNSMLDAEAVKVEKSSGAAPVRVRFEIAPEHRARALAAVTRAVTMSPFRRAGSRPRIVPTSEDETQWEVELQTWATRELELVRATLRRIVNTATASITEGGAP